MKRQKRGAKRNQQAKAKAPAQAKEPEATPSRRDLFRKVGTGALALAVVGGVSWYFVEDVKATIREEDLTRIGQGIPTIVQIHDPQCSRCVALQRETRSAMDAFEDDELQFLVANIRSDKGRRLANEHGVGHVTLLLFDGKGEVLNVLVGNKDSDVLERAFRRHVTRSRS